MPEKKFIEPRVLEGTHVRLEPIAEGDREEIRDLLQSDPESWTLTGQRQMFTNIRFILAIQALEVFHRRTTSDRIMPSCEFNKLRDQLVGSIPASANLKMKEKLRGTYNFVN